MPCGWEGNRGSGVALALLHRLQWFIRLYGLTACMHSTLGMTLGSRVVSVLDSGAEWPGFKSQSRRCQVTVLGKLLTPIVPLFTKQQNW